MLLASAFGAAALAAPGAHASILWISDGTDNIGQVDTVAQDVVAGSVHNTGQPLTDIAFDSSGQMYGTTFTTLVTINKNTGASGVVGTYAGESGMNALLGSNAGLLGGSFANTNVYNISPTGALSLYTHAPSTSSGDLAIHAGTLYGLGNSGGPNTLMTLSGGGAGTNTTLHVGSAAGPTLSTAFGLADDGTTLYAVAGTEVYSVNAANGILTALFDYSTAENGQNLTAVTGAAFVVEGTVTPPPPPSVGVPEPGSLSILGAGAGLLALGGLAARRRRHR
jgi:MYXO-CTERM domain-containing protein